MACLAAAAAAPGGEQPKAKGFVARQTASLKSLLTPFSDPAVNARLVSLCVASALCSVATLIHDTYLPIYLSEQLGLSNTKVSRQTQGLVLKCSVCLMPLCSFQGNVAVDAICSGLILKL